MHHALTGRERDYSLKGGVGMALSAIADVHPKTFPDMVSIYLEFDDLLEIFPGSIISNLFATTTSADVWLLINSIEYKWKMLWRSSYFSQLSEDEIDANTIKNLLEHINEAPCHELPNWIDFLTRYRSIDADIFSKVARILVTRSVENKVCARPLEHIYSNHSNLFGQWFDIFKEDEALTYDAYIAAFNLDQHFDYSGEAIDLLTIQDKNFLLRVVDRVYEAERWPSSHTYMPDLDFLWKRETYLEDVEQYAMYIYHKEENSYRFGGNLFTKIFTKDKGKSVTEELTSRKKDFLRKAVAKNIDDINYVCFIFTAANYMGEDFILELIELFFEKNKSFEDFQKLEYERRTTSWSGSRVPILEREKIHLISILPLLNSVDLLEHRAYIETQIDAKIKHIEYEKKRDYLESRG